MKIVSFQSAHTHTNKMKEARISFLYVSSVRTWGSVHIEGT